MMWWQSGLLAMLDGAALWMLDAALRVNTRLGRTGNIQHDGEVLLLDQLQRCFQRRKASKQRDHDRTRRMAVVVRCHRTRLVRDPQRHAGCHGGTLFRAALDRVHGRRSVGGEPLGRGNLNQRIVAFCDHGVTTVQLRQQCSQHGFRLVPHSGARRSRQLSGKAELTPGVPQTHHGAVHAAHGGVADQRLAQWDVSGSSGEGW